MARLTTLGVKFSYAVETVKGTKPTKFTQLEEASSIGGISLDTEQIDVSALEDYLTQYAAGRQDTGGTWEIEFIMDPDKSVKQIKKLYEDSKAAKTTGLATWFQVSFPDIAQNEAATMSISLIINTYKGLDTKVEPTAAAE